MIYEPKYFLWEELVPPEIFNVFGKNSSMFIDDRILYIIDRIREHYGRPVHVNNWKWIQGESALTLRGFRPPDTKIGASLSQHKFGRAIDFDVQGISAEEVREDIKQNYEKNPFNFISAIEENVSWVHIDIRPIDYSGLKIFYP